MISYHLAFTCAELMSGEDTSTLQIELFHRRLDLNRVEARHVPHGFIQETFYIVNGWKQFQVCFSKMRGWGVPHQCGNFTTTAAKDQTSFGNAGWWLRLV